MEFTTELKDFQQEAVSWMKDMNEKHQGGFNFMEPGLGKSICCINTIKNGESVLIVCPAGLLYNWVNEFKLHTNLKESDILVYHGSDRGGIKCKDCHKNKGVFCRICKNFVKKLERKKIVITSYGIVSRAFFGKHLKENLVFAKTFDKIFFDEVHVLRNKKSLGFISSCLLKGTIKWCITATPIFNSYKEVYVYFQLINYVADYKEWKELVKEKTKIKKMRKINNLVKKMSIKKEKSKVLKTLLPKIETEIVVKMSKFEREFYTCLREYSLTRMELLMNKYNNSKNDIETKMEAMGHFLVYILRLRQVCDSPMLVINSMKRLQNSKDIRSAIKTLKFYNTSKNNNETECPICYDKETDCIINPCGHKYCKDCFEKIKRIKNECSMCRTKIQSVEFLREPVEKQVKLDIPTSKKIQTTINIILEKLELGEKVVVVSQWLTTLTIIKDILKEKDIKSTGLTGSMDISTRMENINSFNKQKDIKVCLISMCASSEGINLTASNNMILVDHWWNKSRMIQVMDRIHRIGQEKQVNIYNLITINTIEEKIQELVKSKERFTSLVVKEWEIEDDDNYDGSWMNHCIKLL